MERRATLMSEQADANFMRSENFYSGNVQGVGFRYTVSRIAERYAIAGFVRNLPDGRVQLVADGEQAEIERFHNEIAETMAENIAATESTTRTSATHGEYQDFSIRH